MTKAPALILALFLLIPFVVFSPSALADDWLMFQHDATHSGYSNTTMQVNPFSVWNFTGKSDLSVAAVADGVVYCSSDGFLRNEIYGVNASTGQLIWNSSYYLTDYTAKFCPAIADGVVYTLTTAYNASNGNFLFNYTNVNASTSPTVADGMVYFGTNINNYFAPGGVVALDGTTGRQVWSFTGAFGQFMNGGMVHYPPAVENGVVYCSSGGGVYALNAANGVLLWNNSAIDKSYGSLGCTSVADGWVYNNVAGKLSCINTNGLSWSVDSNRGNRFAAVKNGVVYINSYALEASSGTVIWDNSLTGLSSPVLADGILFYGHYWYSDEGSHGKWNKHGLVACNATTGEAVWEYTLSGFSDSQDGGYVSVANNMLFYTDESTVYAFSLQPAPVRPVSQPAQANENLLTAALTVSAIIGVAAILLVAKKRQKRAKSG
jgi:outer membrane protein assembly factor BamB